MREATLEAPLLDRRSFLRLSAGTAAAIATVGPSALFAQQEPVLSADPTLRSPSFKGLLTNRLIDLIAARTLALSSSIDPDDNPVLNGERSAVMRSMLLDDTRRHAFTQWLVPPLRKMLIRDRRDYARATQTPVHLREPLQIAVTLPFTVNIYSLIKREHWRVSEGLIQSVDDLSDRVLDLYPTALPVAIRFQQQPLPEKRQLQFAVTQTWDIQRVPTRRNVLMPNRRWVSLKSPSAWLPDWKEEVLVDA